jgi:hypothetical protein
VSVTIAERTVPAAQARRPRDRAVHVGFGASHGVEQRTAEREFGGDGRGKGASGAVRMRRGDARRAQPFDAGAVGEQIHRVPVEMAALDHDGAGAQREQPLGGRGHIVDVRDAPAGHGRGLRQVGGDDRRAWHERLDQRGDRVGGEQRIAPLGQHHRVEHHRRQVVTVEGAGYGPHDIRAAQHADLDGGHRKVLGHRIDLRRHERRLQHLDGPDAGRVLRRDGRERARAEDAEGGERPEIGLDPRAAARIAAGDRQRHGD